MMANPAHTGWAPPIDPSCMPPLQPINPQQIMVASSGARSHHMPIALDGSMVPLGGGGLIGEPVPPRIASVVASEYNNPVPMTRPMMMMQPSVAKDQQQQIMVDAAQLMQHMQQQQSPPALLMMQQQATPSRGPASLASNSVAPSPSGSQQSSPAPVAAYDGAKQGQHITAIADSSGSDGNISFEMDPEAALGLPASQYDVKSEGSE